MSQLGEIYVSLKLDNKQFVGGLKQSEVAAQKTVSSFSAIAKATSGVARNILGVSQALSTHNAAINSTIAVMEKMAWIDRQHIANTKARQGVMEALDAALNKQAAAKTRLLTLNNSTLASINAETLAIQKQAHALGILTTQQLAAAKAANPLAQAKRNLAMRSVGLRQETLALEKGMDNMFKEGRKNLAVIREKENAYKKAGGAVGGLQAHLSKSTGSLRTYRNTTKSATKEVQTFSQRTLELSKHVMMAAPGFAIATAAIASFYRVLRGVKDLLVTSVQIGAEFDHQMAKIAGITKATALEFEGLELIAREMGRTTEWTATQAGEALQFLAMAGFEAQTAIAALPGVLDLATAGQIGLGKAADITTNILTAMRLPVEQLGRVNDVLIETITSTNTNLEKLANSMKYSAPIAAAYGMEIETLSALIGLLGNAGIQASTAGTQLSFGFQRLGKVFSKYGVDVRKADGTTRDYVDALELLEHKGADAYEVMSIFGQRAGRAMTALMGIGSEAVREFIEQLQNAEGAAEKLATLMRDTLVTDWMLLKSVVESIKIDIFKEYADQLKSALQGVTTFLSMHRDHVIALVKTLVAMLKVVVIGGPLSLGLAALIKLFFGTKIAAINAAAGLTVTTAAVATTTKAVTALGIVLKGLFAPLLIGYTVGTWLQEEFVAARKAGVYMVDALFRSFTYLEYGVKLIWEGIKHRWHEAIGEMKKTFAGFLSWIATGLNKIPRSWAKNAAAEIQGYADSLNIVKVTEEDLQKKQGELREELDKRINSLNDAKKGSLEAAESYKKEGKSIDEVTASLEEQRKKAERRNKAMSQYAGLETITEDMIKFLAIQDDIERQMKVLEGGEEAGRIHDLGSAFKDLGEIVRSFAGEELKKWLKENEDSTRTLEEQIEITEGRFLGWFRTLDKATAAKSFTEEVERLKLEMEGLSDVELLERKLTKLFEAAGDKIKMTDEELQKLLNSYGEFKAKAGAETMLKSLQEQIYLLNGGSQAVLEYNKRLGEIEEFAKKGGEGVQGLTDELRELNKELFKLAAFKEIKAIKFNFPGVTDFADPLIDGVGKAVEAMNRLNLAYEEQSRVMEEVANLRKSYYEAEGTSFEEKVALVEALNKREKELSLDSAQAQINSFRTIAGAASQLFGERSKEREALHKLEVGLAAIEMGMQVRKMALDSANTLKAIGNSVKRAAAYGAEAVANALKSIPYPWNLAAAASVVAALAAIGISVGGGGGGGSSKPSNFASGTGSVLGDSEAKSDSINESSQLLREIHSLEYRELQGIHGSMRDLSNSIQGLVNNVVRNLGDFSAESFGIEEYKNKAAWGTDQFKTSLGLNFLPDAIDFTFDSFKNTISLLTKGIGGLLGSSKKMTASGIQLDSFSMGDIMGGGGVEGSSFADVETKKYNWYGKKKKSYETILKELDGDTEQLFTDIFSSLGQSILGLASGLGMDIIEDFNKYIVDIGKIDLTDMSGQEINEHISGILSKTADEMATEFFSHLINAYSELGEGALETVNRINTEMQVGIALLKKTGQGLNLSEVILPDGVVVSIEEQAVHITQALYAMAGGMEEYIKMSEFYFNNFFTEEEKHLYNTELLKDVFKDLNREFPGTRAGFKDLVESLDLTTTEGQYLDTILKQIAPNAHEFFKVLEGGDKAIEEAHKELGKFFETIDFHNLTKGMSGLDISILKINTEIEEWIKKAEDLGYSEQDLNKIRGYGADQIQELLDAEEKLAATRRESVQEQIDILSGVYTQQELDRMKQVEEAVNLGDNALKGLLETLFELQDVVQAAQAAVSSAEGLLRRSIDSYLEGLSEISKAAEDHLRDAEGLLNRSFDAERKAIDGFYENIVDGLKEGLEEAKESAGLLKGVFSSLQSSKKSLQMESLEWAQALFRSAQLELSEFATRARGGDFTGDISDVLGRATKFDTAYYDSFEDYQRDFLKTSILINELEGLAGNQLSSAELAVVRLEEQIEETQTQHKETLDTLQDQLDTLLGIDKSTVLIEEAINNFLKKQDEALKANQYLEEQTKTLNDQYDVLLGIDKSIISVEEAIKSLVLAQTTYSGLTGGSTTGFNTGGSFMVKGRSGSDKLSLPGLRVSSGEMVSVTRNDVMGQMREELISLRKELRQLREENKAGQFMIAKNTSETSKQLRRWDGDGMPEEREALA